MYPKPNIIWSDSIIYGCGLLTGSDGYGLIVRNGHCTLSRNVVKGGAFVVLLFFLCDI